MPHAATTNKGAIAITYHVYQVITRYSNVDTEINTIYDNLYITTRIHNNVGPK